MHVSQFQVACKMSYVYDYIIKLSTIQAEVIYLCPVHKSSKFIICVVLDKEKQDIGSVCGGYQAYGRSVTNCSFTVDI